MLPLQAWGGNLGVEYNSLTAITFFLVFTIIMIGIGAVASRYQTSEEEYFVAGRRGGIVVIGLSIVTSVQSGWAIIGITGTSFELGTEYLLLGMFIIIGFIMSYWLLARKMRMLGEIKNAITAPDAMYYRFNDERIRLLGIASILVGSIGYLAAQYAALGIIGALVLPVGFLEALIISLVIMGIYTVVGGMLAAIWSDAFQALMVMVGGLMTFYYIVTGFPGGVTGMTETIQTSAPAYFDFTLLGMNGFASVGFLISVLVIQFTVAGQPHAITKFYMVRDVSVLKWGALISAIGALFTALYWIAAWFIRAAVESGQISELPTSDAALPVGLIEFAPDLVVAFVLTATVAAIMSSGNAFLNMGASAVVHDFAIEYRGMNPDNAQQVRWGRITTVVLLILAGTVAATFPDLIFVLGAAGWALFASVIFPCVAIAYNWKEATREGALWGAGTGFGLTILFAYIIQYLGLSLPLGFLGGQLAMLIGFAVFVGVSLITNTDNYNDLDDDMKDILDLGRLQGGSISQEGIAADGGSEQEERN